MTLSVGGAIKAAVVTSNLVSGRIFRADKVPEKPTFPYVTFLDPVTMNPALEGDCKTMARARTTFVDLWQKSTAEDPMLPERLVNAIDGAGLTGTSQKVQGCKVTDCTRLDDVDPQIVRHTLTVRVTHAVAVAP